MGTIAGVGWNEETSCGQAGSHIKEFCKDVIEGAGPEDFLKVFPGHIPTAKSGDSLNNEATTLHSKAH